MNLLPQTHKKRDLTQQQERFLELLFENGGQVTAAALDAGYSRGSAAWLKSTLADEIIEHPAPERGDDLRLKAAESLLNRVGVAKQEQINHNVTAVHGVVLLPPKKEVVIDAD